MEIKTIILLLSTFGAIFPITIIQAFSLDDELYLKGHIGSLIFNTNNTNNVDIFSKDKFVLAGDWTFVYKNGVPFFFANISAPMVDGTFNHYHTISNLQINDGKEIKIDKPNNKLIIKGTVDVTLNNEKMWNNTDVDIDFYNNAVLKINLNQTETNYHFAGQPIFGTINSIIKNP